MIIIYKQIINAFLELISIFTSRCFIKNKKIISLSLIILYLLLIVPILFTSTELFFGRDVHAGTIAKEYISGHSLPAFEYLNNHFSGGSLIVGFLTIPFYFLLGESGITLKLVPLIFNLASLILLFLFLDSYFYRNTAILASLFFVLSPPMYP